MSGAAVIRLPVDEDFSGLAANRGPARFCDAVPALHRVFAVPIIGA